MKIIDSHLHLDKVKYRTLEAAFKGLNGELQEASISKAIVLHLIIQGWSLEEVADQINKYERIEAFANIDPNSIDAETDLLRAKNLGFCGLKLHPRIQQFSVDDPNVVALIQYAGELNLPTLIDAFPDGTALMDGFSPFKFASCAKKCPDSKIIWAHMGGHHVIDMMMLAKRLPNVYFDFSYSLLYYQGSSVPKDMIYAMKSMRFDRIFYGSDYPDRSITDTYNASYAYLKESGISSDDLEKLFYRNFTRMMEW
ncbi:amidohydrolase family protein [Bacteriovorax sp. Seq25_V]|uniref:amidohydrolase family protein n=1 Tax=Bacteriovorax sp. Seq25_V TaxID=1201288 RepID=UPI00038A160D|nr:amidohydrolase family protein [Bacteriovorax sp. Seq25_V]EQC43326.1 amidohydrolase family protein [Bacteriovorax sp. Seq25_V]